MVIESSRCRGGGADQKLHETSTCASDWSGNNAEHSQGKSRNSIFEIEWEPWCFYLFFIDFYIFFIYYFSNSLMILLHILSCFVNFHCFCVLFCRQHGETALQLAKRSNCDDIATLIATRKKVLMNLCYSIHEFVPFCVASMCFFRLPASWPKMMHVAYILSNHWTGFSHTDVHTQNFHIRLLCMITSENGA